MNQMTITHSGQMNFFSMKRKSKISVFSSSLFTSQIQTQKWTEMRMETKRSAKCHLCAVRSITLICHGVKRLWEDGGERQVERRRLMSHPLCARCRARVGRVCWRVRVFVSVDVDVGAKRGCEVRVLRMCVCVCVKCA